MEKIVDAGDGGVVVVEGLLLLGAGAERVRDRCAALILLDDGYDDPAKQKRRRRKWTRSGHLGKASYKERGVTADEHGFRRGLRLGALEGARADRAARGAARPNGWTRTRASIGADRAHLERA